VPYTKDWTEKYNDKWYISLSLSQRSVWDQLRSLVKISGDNSRIFQRNFGTISAFFGCDADTSRKILGLFARDGKIELKIHEDKTIEIFVRKYEYYQRLKDPSERSKSRGKFPENSRKIPPLSIAYNNIEEHSIECKSENSKPDNINLESIKIKEWEKLEKAWDEMADAGDLKYFAEKQSINPDEEIQKMLVWLKANPEKAKKNYKRFIINWLTRAVDSAENKNKGNSYAFR
jgi:hypothetical protein